MMAQRVCVFEPCKGKEPWRTCGVKGIRTIISSSKARDDNLHLTLQSTIESDGGSTQIDCHKSCYSLYTSKTMIARLKRKRGHDSGKLLSEPPVRRCRSQLPEFKFKEYCLICGDSCHPLDPKHSNRWKRVIQCQTINRPGQPTFKEVLLDLCEKRNDQWGRDVELRIKGAPSDLPAADAQYHKCCYDSFRKMTSSMHNKPHVIDPSLSECINYMYENSALTFTTVELYDMYCSFEGKLSKKQMLSKLTDYFGNEIVILHVEGCSSILGFRDFLGKSLKLVKDDDVNKVHVNSVVRQVKSEVKVGRHLDYDLGEFTFEKTVDSCSPTLLHLIAQLVSNGEVNKKSLSITQCIQQHITQTPNQTTLGLAVKIHHKFGSSNLVKLLNEHGFITSYEEVLRFRKSAAKFVSENGSKIHELIGLTKRVGPIFGWFDNYDLLVCTPNGRRETHAMALEFQQHSSGILEPGSAKPGVINMTIPRLCKSAANSLHLGGRSVIMEHYTGPKKANPPAVICKFGLTHTGLSYTDVCAKDASLKHALQLDVQWLNSVFHADEPLEWSGYNVALARKTSSPKPATNYIFGPLIDAPPSHPDTVFTTLSYFEKTLGDLGMETIHLSVDMQLYIVATNVKWALYPNRFTSVILRPGGMHTLMSFLGCIGTLMKGSGLDVLVSSAFGCLKSIMNGKSWVRSLRAFRMVSVVLLHDFLKDGEKSLDEISVYIENARQHPTGRLWVDCLLRPTLIAHQFLRAEREGDWILQQHCLRQMLGYFFAAGHWQYARYISWHLLEMEHSLPENAKSDLLAGAHVCRHNEGSWNSVSSDQYGEQTYIKKGKLPGGLKGISLSSDQVAIWIESYHICAHVGLALDSVYSDETNAKREVKHKEEGGERIKNDKEDRKRIQDELAKHSHPLNYVSPKLYNIVNGKIANDEINVHHTAQIGSEMAEHFRSTIPDGFHSKITHKVKTMESVKCGIKVGDKSVHDMGAICTRLLIVGQQRHVCLSQIFQYELCSVPPSLIDDYGCLRKGNKAVLVDRLSERDHHAVDPEVVIVDGQQLLYHVVWPCEGSVTNLALSMKTRLSCYHSEVFVVFDRYDEHSAKDHERIRRAGEGSIEYNITESSPLPNRESIMKNKANKKALSQVLCAQNLGHNITMIGRNEAAFTHDEADVTMVSYLLQAVERGKKVIRVLSDDTDVFILLVYWCWKKQLQVCVQLERWDGHILNISATVDRLGPKCLHILGMHALSGCDTVSYPFGHGKVRALNILLSKSIPGLDNALGEDDASLEELMSTGQEFFTALYGVAEGTCMNKARHDIFMKKSRNKLPSIKLLPPTNQNLLYHVLRAHLQVILWKAADQKHPPTLDITKYGWKIVDGLPSPCIASTPVAPPELMDVVSCKCKAEGKQCSTHGCSCRSSGLSCTYYCVCGGGFCCCNPLTKQVEGEDDCHLWEEDDDNEQEVYKIKDDSDEFLN